MKIKRVEIQAFKSYLVKQDGTFDFTVKDGQPADIVSIYAPNGFGKTSFYDAIDFCMTNNITRFIRDPSSANANNTDARGMNNPGQKQHILRANNAPVNLESRIKVTTDSNEFERKVPKARSGSKDYAYDDKKTKPEERYFRSVMLSQEAIDGFLRESKPEIRYERFMEEQLGGDDTLEKSRLQLQSMLVAVNSRLDSLTRKVIDINDKNIIYDLGIESTVDSSSLITINELVAELNDQGCNFTVFGDEFNDKSNANLLLQVGQVEEQTNAKIAVIDADKFQLDRFVVNFPLYEKSHREIEDLNKQIRTLTKHKNDIELLQVLNKKRSVLTEQLDTRRIELEKISSREKGFPDFVKQMRTKYEFNTELTSIRDSLNNNEQKIKSSHAVCIELDTQKETLRNKNEELKTWKNDASKHFSEITIKEENIHQQDSAELTIREIELENKIVDLKSEGVEVKSFKVEDLDTIIASKFNNEALSLLATKHSKSIVEQKRLNVKLAELNELLDGVKLQKNSISTLIKLGSELINHNRDQHCPLCQYKHESFTVLANAINSNSSLSDYERRHFKDVEACQTLLQQEEAKLKRLNEEFTVQQTINLELLREKLKSALEDLKSVGIILEQVVKDTAEVNRLKGLVIHKTPELFASYIDGEIAKNIEACTLIEFRIEETKDEYQKLKDNDQHLKIDLAASVSKLESHNALLADYLVFLEELRVLKNIIEPKVNEQVLQDIIANKLKNAEDSYDEKQKEVKDNEEALIVLNEEYTVSFFDKPVEKKEELILQINEFSKKLVPLNESVRELYTMTKKLEQEHLLADGNWVALKQKIVHKVTTLEDLRKSNTILISRLTLLTTLAEKVLKYIKFIKSTDELKEFKLKIEKYIGIKESLLTDLRTINVSLESQVNHYFHVDLINTIYQKIDPHPEFKKIDFRCIFHEDAKPKLQVYITDDDGQNIVSPTLSFSSAQVNVLSLSIFLAKAINTKNAGEDVDCIFIDDPVQSMDSINVLGVIDLFRNLSVKGKQIIISTHDDNFHALLKQKIPEHLFKSKFLELESFGKVASHEGQ